LSVAIELNRFDRGGLEKVVLDTALSMRARGIRVVVVSVEPIGQLGSLAVEAGIEVVRLPAFGRRLFYAALLRRRGVNVAVAHNSRAGYPVFRALGIPCVAFIHNVNAMFHSSDLRRHLADDRFVAHYISVSNCATRYAVGKLGLDRRKISTIPNGLIVEEHRRAEVTPASVTRATLGLSDTDYVFLNLASYNLHKGHFLMLRAMELIAARRKDVKILCAGGEAVPRHVARLRAEIARRGMGGFMLMPGRFDNAADLHRLSDAFLLPSFIEGWSIAMNEAMFHAKPMILTDTGGAREVVVDGDIGIVVPNEYGDALNLDARLLDELALSPRDYRTAPALAEAMLQFADNRERWAAAGALGRRKILEQHDFASIVDRHIELLRAVADRGASA